MERNEWKGWRTTVCLMLVSCVVALTASHGGFRNVTIDNIEVYDTFRSAIAIETVDGGGLENVRVTRVQARNTGNPLFIRLGHRAGEKPEFIFCPLCCRHTACLSGRSDRCGAVR